LGLYAPARPKFALKNLRKALCSRGFLRFLAGCLLDTRQGGVKQFERLALKRCRLGGEND
jgi:hypothetical protein